MQKARSGTELKVQTGQIDAKKLWTQPILLASAWRLHTCNQLASTGDCCKFTFQKGFWYYRSHLAYQRLCLA